MPLAVILKSDQIHWNWHGSVKLSEGNFTMQNLIDGKKLMLKYLSSPKTPSVLHLTYLRL